MKALLFVVACAATAMLPLSASAQTSTADIGAGPGGWDFLIGSWSCTNSMPPTGGPPAFTFTANKTARGALSMHLTATNFDSLAYLAYDAKSKTWYNPTIYADGALTSESSKQTGPKTVWTGTYTGTSGTTQEIRDTYTLSDLTKFNDLSEGMVSGAWKAQANITCTKS